MPGRWFLQSEHFIQLRFKHLGMVQLSHSNDHSNVNKNKKRLDRNTQGPHLWGNVRHAENVTNMDITTLLLCC